MNDNSNYSNLPAMAGKDALEEVCQLQNTTCTLLTNPPATWDSRRRRENAVYVTADLLIDPTARLVYKKGEILSLGMTEFNLLLHLVMHPTMMIPRPVLLNIAEMRYHHVLNDNTLSKHINRLRRNLQKYEGLTYIRTGNSVGYKWNFDVATRYLQR